MSRSEQQSAQIKTVWLFGLFFGSGAPTGVLLESLAVILSGRGCRVEVITGRSAYSAGAGGASRFRGAVFRLYSGPARAAGVGGRLLAWSAYYLSVLLFICSRRLPDVVVLTTTPPLLHFALALRRLVTRSRCRLVLWNQDTYPEILAAVGLLRVGGVPYRALAAVERWATARVDCAVALDGAMGAILARHGARRVSVVPNWDAHADEPNPAPAAPDTLDVVLSAARAWCRFVVLYSGNYGWGHDLGPLFAWCRAHPGQSDFFFVFVGGGEKWGELERVIGELGPGRCWCGPYLPRERFVRLLGQVDFGLVTLEDRCAGLMSPSKIHAYLAAGKPLIYLGPAGSNVADAIEGYDCGARAGYEDPAAVGAALGALAGGASDYPRLAANAARAARALHTEAAADDAFGRLLAEL